MLRGGPAYLFGFRDQVLLLGDHHVPGTVLRLQIEVPTGYSPVLEGPTVLIISLCGR